MTNSLQYLKYYGNLWTPQLPNLFEFNISQIQKLAYFLV